MNRRSQKRVVALLMAIFLVIPLLGGLLAVTQSADDSNQQEDLAQTAATADSLPRASDLPTIQLDELPAEAVDTLQLIAQGGPYPYSRDGVPFENREGILPEKPTGWYLEYTVPTPGSDDRGARRLVVGQNREVYYTDDHYESFRELVLG